MAKRAFISVSDKRGIVELAKGLVDCGYEIVSTGGTAMTLDSNAVPIISVSDVTGFPECLDGRVKTLHPKVHAGILAVRDNAEHMQELAELDIAPIDMVVVNLYPFKETILKQNTTFEDAIENIDIGGPSMLRAAAKNFQDVAVVVDTADYPRILEELREQGEVSLATKHGLCRKVFEHTAAYDALIFSYLSKQAGAELPEKLTLTYEKAQELRYGENPHQRAVYYKEIGNFPECLHEAEVLHGKELSYNNINDANGAIELLKEFDEVSCVAIKHANPCGVASAKTVREAYILAHDADPISIFGGIVAVNDTVDRDTALEMCKIFLEIVVAPDYTDDALSVLKSKKNLRILKLPQVGRKQPKGTLDMKKVGGGLLVQDADLELLLGSLSTVTKRQPLETELEDMLFAWKIVKHVKSNAIVLAKGKRTLGIGCGQTNRIWALEQAIEHSGDEVEGAVMASDAFFPFDDCVTVSAKAGIRSIIQPGGSIRDEDSIKACDNFGLSMVFTNIRHFKH
ncbi:MAG: bifunctional phosphoribosylaminoimidazolecarboxamide formyltransferase/IMP cyclohydrolase [Christensenellales bacterium]|jgi:phosphoribosylaminoimidazolecarboxamide formyltransferase/IMP cyclohydrolase